VKKSNKFVLGVVSPGGGGGVRGKPYIHVLLLHSLVAVVVVVVVVVMAQCWCLCFSFFMIIQIEPALGTVINDALDIKCISDDSTKEVIRGIRLHFNK